VLHKKGGFAPQDFSEENLPPQGILVSMKGLGVDCAVATGKGRFAHGFGIGGVGVGC
jgi:hypothetical protein